MFALPKTFLRSTLVRTVSRSQRPPYQGARFGMNFHCTVCLLRWLSRVGDLRCFSSSSVADWYAEALSEIITLGSDFRLGNRRKASINVGTVRSFTTSKCTARVFAQANRQIYDLDMP